MKTHGMCSPKRNWSAFLHSLRKTLPMSAKLEIQANTWDGIDSNGEKT